MSHPSRTAIEVFQNHNTGRYGYRVRFLGSSTFHREFDTCLTLQGALDCCDPHRERIWEEPGDANEDVLLVSRDSKAGNVSWRIEHLSIAELWADRARKNVVRNPAW